MPAASFKSSQGWGDRRERFNEMFEMCLEGKSLSDIGKTFGITKQAVSYFLKNNANPRQFELIQEAFTKRIPSSWYESEIVKHLETGLTCAEVAKVVGCHVSSVKRVSARWKRSQRQLVEL
jgi:DNA-binding CsgD family transcriptional regulator